MPNKTNLYYYLDINLRDMKVVGWGTTPHATLTGDTDDPGVHRVFLTKGQYNKLAKYLEQIRHPRQPVLSGYDDQFGPQGFFLSLIKAIFWPASLVYSGLGALGVQ